MGVLEITCTSSYTLSERLKIVVFTIDKTSSIYFNEETWAIENEGFEAFEKVIFLLL